MFLFIFAHTHESVCWMQCKCYIVVLMLYLLFPFCIHAEGNKDKYVYRPTLSDTVLQSIFQFSSFYSQVVDEYKADLYMKGRLKVHKSNKLVRYIPSMFRLEDGVNDYVIESVSEMHYTAPDIYNRKVKAVSSTLRRNRGQLTDLTDFLNMNVYSSSIMGDKLLSPLNKGASKYYTYQLDSVAGPSDSLCYRIRIVPKYEGTQLVSGYVWVSDQIWSIREIYMEGKFDMIEFKLRNIMGEKDNEEFLPVRLNLDIDFKFMGNHLEMNADAWVKYNMVEFYKGGERRKSKKKHSHDLTEFYELTMDSTQMITGREAFDTIRPIPLQYDEYHILLPQARKRP